jgi:uridylate kinase
MSIASQSAEIIDVGRAASFARSVARWNYFVALTKPRVMSLASGSERPGASTKTCARSRAAACRAEKR